jgi:hypothetical protein
MGDSTMEEEYEDSEQRAGVCHTQWEERAVNDSLLKAVRERGRKRTEFGHGILTADRYVRTVLEMSKASTCCQAAGGARCDGGACKNPGVSPCGLLKKAAETLVYGNPDMKAGEIASGSHRFKDFMEGAPEGIEVPKNTLILLRHVLTTSRRDRDGDILRTKGAIVDPKMFLLWQHLHTLPIGKYLYTAQHDDSTLKVVSAIIDINELCHDAAVMIDNKMGRFSHGFRALEFTEIKSDEADPTSPGGYDVKRFEIMEASLVSVPSNVDAETDEVLYSFIEEGKLTSPLLKRWGEAVKEKRPASVPGISINTSDGWNVDAKWLDPDGSFDRFEAIDPKQGEAEDEKQSRIGGQAEGRDAGPSEEADDGPKQEEAKETEDAKVKEMRPGYGGLEGSWEWTIEKLRANAKSYLVGNGVSIGERDWTWIVGVYPDHGIICVEKSEPGVTDEFRYFKAGWKLEKKEPKFVGEPRAVEVEVSTEIRERSPSWETKGEKRGRVLSKANEAKIRDVVESVRDAAKAEGVPRAIKSMLREAASMLDAVLASIGDSEQETSAFADVNTSMAQVLAFADSKQRRRMIELLEGLEDVEQMKRTTRRLRPLLGRSA